MCSHPNHILDGRPAVDQSLPRADEFGGERTDHVGAYQRPVGAAKHQLQQAVLTGDNTARRRAQLAAADLARKCRPTRSLAQSFPRVKGVSESALVENPPQLTEGAGPGRSEAADRYAGVAGDLGVVPGALVEHGVDEGALAWG